jgi:NADH:ubiquinone oxidoreductase subunit H
MRRGPNVVGPWGLFQSFADLLKFVFKEPVIPMVPTRRCSCSRRW